MYNQKIMKIIKFNKYIYIPVLVIITLVTISLLLCTDLIAEHVHTVIPDTIYRSPRLNAINLTAHIQDKKIKSILNLEGMQMDNDWYRVELSTSRKFQIQHYDLALSPNKLPTQADLIKLINILQKSPKPLLIHCKRGIDRTGLAAAISLILSERHDSLKAAKKQISWHYHNFSPNTVGYQVLRNYITWLHQNHLHNNNMIFLTWANTAQPLKKKYFGWNY